MHLPGDLDRGLCETLRGHVDNVRVDRSQFALVYEDIILQLDKLTPHQTEKLSDVTASDQDVHIRAAAGAGKTFVALNLLVKDLEQERQCLYVARNPALCYSVVKWVYKRKVSTRHLMLLFEPLEDGLRTVEIVNDRVVTSLVKNPGFDLVVVDEAHHLYRDDKLRSLLERQIRASARRVILSDLSQSDGRLVSYPSMQEVLLTEVVRSSKRVVAGAMQFQLGGEAKLLTQCHHESTGPPLRTFLFDAGDDRIGKYASETVCAIDAIVSDFSGLSLHDRVAIILPNHDFATELKPRLETHLKKKYHGRFELVKASDAAVVVGDRSKGT